MEAQIAIEILKSNYPKTCKMVDGRYEGGFDDKKCELGQAMTAAIEALEKQVPVSRIIIEGKYFCPKCKKSDALSWVLRMWTKSILGFMDEKLILRSEKMAELNEYWSGKAVEEYKGYLYEKKMQDYVYQCERIAPHVIHNAQVVQDGNQWCCILGDLPTGVVGFGDTPEQACAEFDRVWREGK